MQKLVVKENGSQDVYESWQYDADERQYVTSTGKEFPVEIRNGHMGWDIVEFKQQNPLLEGLTGRQRYYFVHSYHAVCDSPENVLMTCDYGYDFACSVVRDNIYGVQFHPEKSHDFGMALLENFVNRC